MTARTAGRASPASGSGAAGPTPWSPSSRGLGTGRTRSPSRRPPSPGTWGDAPLPQPALDSTASINSAELDFSVAAATEGRRRPGERRRGGPGGGRERLEDGGRDRLRGRRTCTPSAGGGTRDGLVGAQRCEFEMCPSLVFMLVHSCLFVLISTFLLCSRHLSALSHRNKKTDQHGQSPPRPLRESPVDEP